MNRYSLQKKDRISPLTGVDIAFTFALFLSKQQVKAMSDFAKLYPEPNAHYHIAAMS